jgi:hypothetical protein
LRGALQAADPVNTAAEKLLKPEASADRRLVEWQAEPTQTVGEGKFRAARKDLAHTSKTEQIG